MALTLVSCKIPAADTPVVGVTLDPYVLVRRADSGTTATAEEVPEEGHSDARFSLRFRWYRSQINRSGLVCWVHQDREATLQCTICARYAQTANEKRQSYHCSSDCLKQHWGAHRELHIKQHKRAQGGGGTENGYASHLSDYTARGGSHSNSETWVEVGRARQFTPGDDDCYTTLKVDVVVVDTLARSPYLEVGKTFTSATARVRLAPKLPKRSLIPLPSPKASTAPGKFSVVTYNLLADLYTNTSDMFSCQKWMLSWSYRRQNLLAELVAYNADILCLQEVQSNHFHEFLMPELQKHGYTAVYKKKTTELYTANKFAIDGCATFFRKDRFALVKKYEVEFNKAALSLADSLGEDLKKVALNRLLKDNVALIAVLEALDPPLQEGSVNPRRQLICVANTHIHANPELNDVKLWQVHTLLKGLEKIATSADIPMIVAGDFNSVPGSAAHDLLTQRSVRPDHKELKNDPLGIFRPLTKLHHNLVLASAYAAAAENGSTDASSQKQRKCLDLKHKEPKYTAWSKAFKGTLDYIFHTSESLVPVSTLELPDDSEMSRHNGMPNESWSSDHIALMAEFQYVQS